MQYGDIYEHCTAAGWRHLALAGTGELAEIAILTAREHDVVLLGVIAPGQPAGNCLGLPIVAAVSALDRPDAVILTALNGSQTAYDSLLESLPANRLLAPKMLSVERSPEAAAMPKPC